jgi:hypothetical protein
LSKPLSGNKTGGASSWVHQANNSTYACSPEDHMGPLTPGSADISVLSTTEHKTSASPPAAIPSHRRSKSTQQRQCLGVACTTDSVLHAMLHMQACADQLVHTHWAALAARLCGPCTCDALLLSSQTPDTCVRCRQQASWLQHTSMFVFIC